MGTFSEDLVDICYATQRDVTVAVSKVQRDRISSIFTSFAVQGSYITFDSYDTPHSTSQRVLALRTNTLPSTSSDTTKNSQ